MSLKFSTQLDVRIQKLVYEGFGLVKHEGYIIFVPKTLPGDRVLIEVTSKKRRAYFAKVIEMLEPSPYRRVSSCPHIADCGGCQMMDVSYEQQCEIKKDLLLDIYERQGKEFLDCLDDIVPCDQQRYHRNKMEFAFSRQDGQIQIGLKKKQSFTDVVPIRDCQLLSAESNDILAFATDFFNQSQFSLWDSHKQEGCLRHLMIRHSKYQDAYMLCVEASEKDERFLNFAKEVQAAFPKVVSVYSLIVTEKKGQPTTREAHLLSGEALIKEAIGDKLFEISPLSFFQTNSAQVQRLYDTVKDSCQLKPSSSLLDLYCGTGSIGLYCADSVSQLIGIEENASAVADAKKNAALNGIENAEFIEGRVKNILKFQRFDVDCVVVDPPRAGMVPKAIKRLIDQQCKRIVYVSCNPVTLIRDLKDFKAGGYAVKKIVPVDMFPHTYHIESVVSLELH